MTSATGDVLLFAVLPYVAIAVFAGGHIWRYRYDKFGWTTRSSQLHERRLLRLGSPLFHFGILFVVLGHVGGLLIPESWTEAAGISESVYHGVAFGIGTVAGVCTLAGAAILIYRRRTVGPVFSATTRNDKIMYVLLIGTLLLGLGATVLGNLTGHPHDYRQTVAPWFRSIFYLHPDTDLIRAAPIGFRLHVLAAWVLFAFWPFSRLVHVFSAPVGYLTRPYIVYRSRDEQLGSRTPRRGWDRPG
ncbi:respiratory nitrate reductase subunit gamma [Actinoplanes sp. L3-i22]|uniref:respiratory nitrate reductase subunit gamma n=1 Tax=Actinoplanes sp. L3-i22 TaxID=2836373 RepID=UPI001C78780C|nr:respiratory nitrate reductase subunit gamma [Actinoplanes sp. L3-i22]BCY09329.1 nitrate reductase subunit gamma [Actinoplanes sp. L3-i22]